MKQELNRSQKLQKEALKRIPGMTQLLSKRPDMFTLGVWPGYYKKASGARIWDLDDTSYIDMSISGIGANVLGYADPDVDNAVIEAIKNGSSSSLNCYEDVDLANLLCELHPWADMVRYARTGGEVMSVAVRIARAHTGRDVIAFCGYHGWHDWYLAANLAQDYALDGHLIPGLSPAGVPKQLAGTAFPFEYNKLDQLEKIVSGHGKNLGAIVMEPIRNFNPEPGFIEGVRKTADETGAVLIVDEISAGFRFNTGGAHLKFFPKNCMPDLAVFSKALGNGYPIAAVIGISAVMASAQKSFISSTNWTERTGPVAAIATIKKHRANAVGDHLYDLGEKVEQGWIQAGGINGLNIHTGGIKQMLHFSFNHEKETVLKALFIQEMLKKGFLASNLFYAMYAHTHEHVNAYLEAVNQVFEKISQWLKKGNIESHLEGNPSQTGFKRIA